PAFLARVEIEVRWQDGPEPVGVVRVVPCSGPHPAFTIALLAESGKPPVPPLLSASAREGLKGNPITTPVGPAVVRRVLTSRAVLVSGAEPPVSARFPVNIDEHSKAGLPSVLGARPDEQQLLAYFHGRISEEDLIELLEQRAAQALTGGQATTPQDAERLRQL